MLSDKLNLNRLDGVYLTLLILISSFITCKMILFNHNLGIYCADVIVYYFNSLNFAGANPDNLLGNSNMFLSPVLCFLTSILIRLGITDTFSILITTGVFGIVGNIGLYVLLKYKFSSILSFTGAVFYSSASIMLMWCSNGTFDISTVAISVWLMIFTIIAIDKDSKFYILAIPVFVLAFFSRYTAGFMLPLMILYFFQKHDLFKNIDNILSERKTLKNNFNNFIKSKEFRYIIIGSILGIVLAIIIIETILNSGSPLTFITQTKDSIGGFQGHINDSNYNTDILFYLENFLNYLFTTNIVFNELNPTYTSPSPVAYLALLILIAGAILKLKSIKTVKNTFKTSNYHKVLKSSIVILAIIAIVGLKISFLVTNIAILVIALIISTLTDKYCSKLTILMACWFLIYFIFFSLNNIKLDRYMITVMPAVSYAFIYCLNEITERINKTNLIAAILILIFLFSAISFTDNLERPETLTNIDETYDFLVNYDSDLLNQEIISQSYRYAALYLQMNMTPVKSNYMNHLDSNNYTYIILNTKNTLKYNSTLSNDFEKIYHNKDYNIFKRK